MAISRELASEQVRMIADPGPLGLGAFALTTFLLSLVNAGILPKDAEPVVLGLRWPTVGSRSTRRNVGIP